jgi:hypothetical protein
MPIIHILGLQQSPKWGKFAQPGANPTIVSYNVSVVKIYIATNSIARFRIIIFSSDVKTL